MDKDSEDILKRAIEQAIKNSTKTTNDWPSPQLYFLTNHLRKPTGKFLDLSIKELNGQIVVFFQLENYKKQTKFNIEKIFKEGVFWTAFFDVEDYKAIQTKIRNFEKLTLSDKINFFRKYLK